MSDLGKFLHVADEYICAKMREVERGRGLFTIDPDGTFRVTKPRRYPVYSVSAGFVINERHRADVAVLGGADG